MYKEAVSILLILFIAVLFLNPGHLTMPESIVSMMIVGIITAFLFFAAYILNEKSADEREAIHILRAGRISYLSGVATLIAGIIVQGINHEIDHWLIIVLCVMLLSKLISRIYSRLKM